LTIEQTRVNKLKLDWENYNPMKPNLLEQNNLEIDLDVWFLILTRTYFFRTGIVWENTAILAIRLLVNKTLQFWMPRNVGRYFEKKLTAKEFTGIFPANQVNVMILELSDESGKVLQRCLTLRQSTKKPRCSNIQLYLFYCSEDSGKTDYNFV
jgi:5-methyltetrahydrofolate--homocysteine methyltransferase